MMSWRHVCEGFIRTFSGVYELLSAPFHLLVVHNFDYLYKGPVYKRPINQEERGEVRFLLIKGRGQKIDDVFYKHHKFGIIDFKGIKTNTDSQRKVFNHSKNVLLIVFLL